MLQHLYTDLTYNILHYPKFQDKPELLNAITPELTEVSINYPCGNSQDDMYTVKYMSEVPINGLQLLQFVHEFYNKELSDVSIVSMFEFLEYKFKSEKCILDIKKKYYDGEIIRMIDFMKYTVWFKGFKKEGDGTWSVILTD